MKKLLPVSILLVLIILAYLGYRYNRAQAPAVNNTQNQNTNTNSPATVSSVKVALIALGDDGKMGEKVGCGDSVALVNYNVTATTQPLNAAMSKLFSLGTDTVKDPATNSDLYNVIYKMQNHPSGVNFDHATIENGVAKIYLTGLMTGLGGICDSPRVPAQIEGTAKQFSTVTSVETYLNNQKVDWQQFQSMK